MCMRDSLYRRGLMRSWEPDALTVSVGNIGWGGSGKTPVAGWLLDWAEKNNIEALLLTRGYKAKPVSYPYLVKPGALAEEAGDEPLMLATQHRKAHVVVDPDRTRAGKWAMKNFTPGSSFWTTDFSTWRSNATSILSYSESKTSTRNGTASSRPAHGVNRPQP